MSDNIKMNTEWKEVLENEFSKPYFLELKSYLQNEKLQNSVIYPPGKEIFAALDVTPLSNVKVVILGQDPYHGHGQANGLCFSVNDGIKIPPSLLNIFKELQDDLGCSIPQSGNLMAWAQQGVLLLNATLTVRQNEAGSHQGKGWETLTDEIIRIVSKSKEHIVFLLWGKFAQSKSILIDNSRHLVLQAPHPSPFSAHTGFKGCKHFSKTNEYLVSYDINPIKWCIS